MPASCLLPHLLRTAFAAAAVGLALFAPLGAAESAPPTIALAPIVRDDADAEPGDTESLTPLLQAGLSEDPRWRMVERARLKVLETEWTFARGGLADTATALREIRPLGASLLLVCRPESGDLSRPFASCEVIDALTAEPLASVRAELSDRPFARWYRNPPPQDVQAIAASFREALTKGLAARAAQSGRRLLTPLFFTGHFDSAGQLENALAAKLDPAPGWRLRRPLRLDGSLAESLLAATGFSSGAADASAGAGAYLWGHIETGGPAGTTTSLRYWIWHGNSAPEEHRAQGDVSALVDHILGTLATSLTRNMALTAPQSAIEETRLRLAREIIETARSLARSTELPHNRFFSRLPQHMKFEPLRAQVMRLLASAAFLAPTDPEAQELWLRTAFDREASLNIDWDQNGPSIPRYPLTAEARRLDREFVAFADTFWRRTDGSLDLRLLNAAYQRDSSRLKQPTALAELRRLAAIIGEPSPEEMAPHLALLGKWLRALEETCPEYQNREAKMNALLRSGPSTGPSRFEPPPAETIQTFETLWPLLRILRQFPNRPVNLTNFYSFDSPRLKELLADQVRVGPRPTPQPRIITSTQPSLLAAPPPPAPPAPLSPPVVPADADVRRRQEERRAFFESIKDKSTAEQSRLRQAFLDKQLAESGLLNRIPKPPPSPAERMRSAASESAPPVIEISAIPALSPEERLARLREACARPGQIEVIRALLAAGADPLGEPSDRRPPILVAILAGREAYVEALLDARPDLRRRWTEANSTGPAGVYLAHAALGRNMPAVAKKIIELHPEQMKGVHVRGGDSLLGIALKHGDPALVRRLVGLGARCSSVSDDSLITLASRCARVNAQPAGQMLPFLYVRDMVRLLRDIQPDVINVVDDGRSPLLIAVLNRNHELVEELIAAGASVKRGWLLDRSIPDLAANDPVLQRLLSGEPLARARSAPPGGSGPDGAEIVAQIERRGAAALASLKLTPDLLAYQDAKKWTLLHHALHLENEAQALRLIAAGAPLEAASIRGQTPLTFAVFSRLPRVVDALLARGANPSGRGNDEAVSPLRAATIKEDLALMRRLIAAGADLDQVVGDDRMPLLCAAIWNGQNIETIRTLVDAGARLDRTNHAGYGPLEHAIGKNRVEVLEFLKRKGASWSQPTDNPDHTPLAFAVRNKARDAILFLLSQGERDPGALAYATDPDIRGLLSDAMQQDGGGKAFANEELWPAICRDREHWKERVDAHLASGGDVNYATLDWTPLILAISETNVELVRHLLAKGADPKSLPLRNRNKPHWDLSDVGSLRLGWNIHYIGRKSRFVETDFAEIVKIIVPLNPADDNQWLFFQMVESRHWVAAEAFVKAGIQPTDYMRETLVTNGRLKGADLDRGLTILGGRATPASPSRKPAAP